MTNLQVIYEFISSTLEPSGPLTQVAAAIDSIPEPETVSPDGIKVSLMSSREFWLSMGIMAFGFAVIAGQLFYVRGTDENGKRSISSESGIRLTIVSMIIVGALVLIASGYSENQIGPAMGLFGTVAGYLIGRQDK